MNVIIEIFVIISNIDNIVILCQLNRYTYFSIVEQKYLLPALVPTHLWCSLHLPFSSSYSRIRHFNIYIHLSHILYHTVNPSFLRPSCFSPSFLRVMNIHGRYSSSHVLFLSPHHISIPPQTIPFKIFRKK
jgi:hypothetical protein